MLHFIYKRGALKTLAQNQDRSRQRLILSSMLLAFKANIFRALSKLRCMFTDDWEKNLSSSFKSEV